MFDNCKFCPTSEVPTILGLRAIILLQVTSWMRDYKMLKAGSMRCRGKRAQKVDVPKRKITSAK
ncbi:MAG: hypothetical protein DMG93_04195 [Acidobacteria bacterium]|nr:MAG: hypothetical protein DMG93_04195 [Acidobacteriota bacterium]